MDWHIGGLVLQYGLAGVAAVVNGTIFLLKNPNKYTEMDVVSKWTCEKFLYITLAIVLLYLTLGQLRRIRHQICSKRLLSAELSDRDHQ